jgi:hypothetical protein
MYCSSDQVRTHVTKEGWSKKILAHTRIHIPQRYRCSGERNGLIPAQGPSTTPSLHRRTLNRRWQKRHLLHTPDTARLYTVDLIRHECGVGNKVAHLASLSSDHNTTTLARPPGRETASDVDVPAEPPSRTSISVSSNTHKFQLFRHR